MSLVFSLPEYRQFQGSWSVPRRSGSQATKFWLLVESSKLGLMQESFKLVKIEQKVVERKIWWEFKMKDAQEHKFSFGLGVYQQYWIAFIQDTCSFSSKQNLSQSLS